MYKCKVIVAYSLGRGDSHWNYGWVDWDGQDYEDLYEIVSEYGKSEEKNLQQMVDRTIVVKHAAVVETCNITEGKNQCGSCECFFDKDDDGDCPFCGSGNWVVGGIDDSFDYHCKKCEQYFNTPDRGNCPHCGSGLITFHAKDLDGNKECFNHCPKCDATDPDIEWGDKDWGDISAWQNATCNKCGCEFTEIYEYVHTEIDGQ